MEDEEKQLTVRQLFRVFDPNSFNDIFSSDKSLIRAHIYGSDITEFTNFTSHVAESLLADKPIDHDLLVRKRSETYVRDIFIDSKGDFINPILGATRLMEQAKRLADALELRNTRPDLGLHTFQNSQTARMVLVDLDEFFKESSLEYKKYRADRGGTVYYG